MLFLTQKYLDGLLLTVRKAKHTRSLVVPHISMSVVFLYGLFVCLKSDRTHPRCIKIKRGIHKKKTLTPFLDDCITKKMKYRSFKLK
jgi:hypothetical protein